MTQRATRLAAGLVAVSAWAGLALQFWVSAQAMSANGFGPVVIVIRFLSYFTVLTNLGVALTMTVPLVAPRTRLGGWFARPAVRAAMAGYIALVLIVYSLLLRHVWAPQGLARLADALLHDVTPALYLLFWWWFVRRGETSWRQLPAWVVYPAVFVAYSMLNGALTDFYPYHFIDVGALGLGRALLNGLGLLVALLVIATILMALDRLRGNARGAAYDAEFHTKGEVP